MNISQFIDYAVHKDSVEKEDIIALCNNAKQNNFYSVSIPSSFVAFAKQLLKGTSVKICAIIGSPLGNDSTNSKISEAKKAIQEGAFEIDMTINLAALKKKNFIAVLRDVNDVKLSIGHTVLKACIEITQLSKNEIIKSCEICLDTSVDYIKTSNTFVRNSATLTAVKIIKKTVREGLKIKASGDIKDYETAIKYLDAGAERIGTSSIIEMKEHSRLLSNSKIYKQYLESKNKTNLTAKKETSLM